jgi:GDPmannose 4,6-dehydratase
VRDFAQVAALELGFDIVWVGNGVDERGVDRKTNRTIITIDPKYYRPIGVESLVGSPLKAEMELGWTRKVGFAELVGAMARSDDKQAQDRSLAF